jgi:hypothetical protein
METRLTWESPEPLAPALPRADPALSIDITAVQHFSECHGFALMEIPLSRKSSSLCNRAVTAHGCHLPFYKESK